MVPRTNNSLRFTAGMVAALSMMGVGATSLRGTVFDFHAWPQASGVVASSVELAAADVVAPLGVGGGLAAVTGGVAALVPAEDGVGSVAGGAVAGTPDPQLLAQSAPPGARPADGGAGRGGVTLVDTDADSGGTGSSGPLTPTPTQGPVVKGVPVALDTTGDGITDTWRQTRPAQSTEGATAKEKAKEKEKEKETTTTVFSVEPPTSIVAAPEPVAEPAPDPEPVADPVPEPEPVPDPIPEPAPAPAPDPDPVPAPDPAAEPAPAVDPAPAPEPATAADPAPVPEPAPAEPAAQ